jgi:broad specificity phosphatase PhoE
MISHVSDMASFTSAPKLYLVRHGETDWNAEGRLQGGRDIPLNGLGRKQAAEAAERLRVVVPQFAALDFVASPLSRTRETMHILRSTLGLVPAEYRTDERLREITFGQWEGHTWREVRKMDEARARLREQDKWHFIPPGGESYEMLSSRIRPWLEGLQGPTLAVAHGGIARALMVMIGGGVPAEAVRADIHQGQVLVFEGGQVRWA